MLTSCCNKVQPDHGPAGAPRPRQDEAMNFLTEQGTFGLICAVLGIAGGLWLSRTLRSKYGIGVRKPGTKPPVYSSRQEMRKAERQKAKKEAR